MCLLILCLNFNLMEKVLLLTDRRNPCRPMSFRKLTVTKKHLGGKRGEAENYVVLYYERNIICYCFKFQAQNDSTDQKDFFLIYENNLYFNAKLFD